jgi:DNA modification methylase
VLFASGKFVNLLINTNPKNFRHDLISEKNLPTGFLDAKVRPLRIHENVLVFARRFKGSTYNPQMVKGKRHGRGSDTRTARHYSMANKKIPKTITGLYYQRSILRFPNRGSGKSLHPTQKNLELMEWLVRTYSRRGDTIVEPFAGSGSTAVAAVRNERKVIAVETSEEYCEIAARRLEAGK